MSFVRIYDQFSSIVADVATRTGIAVQYLWGHPIEIIETLRQMSRDKSTEEDKFPLIALFTDYTETRGTDPSIDSVVRLHFIIATLTRPDYTAVERATNNFKPVLYPLYDQFLKSVIASGYYKNSSWQNIQHTKTDRFFWGRNGLYLNTGNVFDDYIDCIELDNMELTVLRTC